MSSLGRSSQRDADDSGIGWTLRTFLWFSFLVQFRTRFNFETRGMVIFTSGPQQVQINEYLTKSSLFLGSPSGATINSDCVQMDLKTSSFGSCTPRYHFLSKDFEATLQVSYKGNSLEVGQWICSTDLLQPSSFKKRPRLLPHDIKMYTFIPQSTTGLQETIGPQLQEASLHFTQKVLNSSRNRKRKKLKTLHPKKRFLREYLWMQQTS
ncbi:hypothetical protein GDO86_016968 [Hymenochirus boettgeri]|uniref:Uncharacterized protein n=1 Tax=Hymenochirus boettgeri TaxID=247094 RepID=A0A8T2IN88_9PIPI|nr:hypothetical protein GDO86_016968 [Hymenochirus boettgeri]